MTSEETAAAGTGTAPSETAAARTEGAAPDFAGGFDAGAYLAGAGLTLETAAAAGAALAALETLDAQLSAEIDRRVADHYTDLLGQAGALRQTAAAVRAIAEQAAALRAALLRVRAEMLAPYERIRARTEQLQQLHDSAEVVRSVRAYAQHLRALREAADAGDTVRAAAALRALAALRASPAAAPRLAGVRLVADTRAYVDAAAARLRAAAADRMRAGLAQLNQAEIATALLAFHALGTLDADAAAALADTTDAAAAGIHSALYGGSPTTTTTTTAAASSSNQGQVQGQQGTDAWRRVAGALDVLGRACGQAAALTKAFAAVKDPAAGDALAAHTAAFRERSPLAVLWARLTQRLHGELQGLARAHPAVAATLTADYPKLLRACQDFCARNAAVLAGVPDAAVPLLACIKTFEADYVDRARTDVCAAVDRALAAAAAPPSSSPLLTASSPAVPARSASAGAGGDDAGFAELARTMAALLEGARCSPRLVELVARDVVAAGVAYLDQQLRARVHTGADSVQVRDRMTAAQQANAAVLQHAVAAQGALAQLPAAVLWLAPAPARALRDACARLDGAAAACVAPLFQSAAKYLEGALYLMHTEDFSADVPQGQQQQQQQEVAASPYMVSFEKGLRHFHTQFVARLVPCAVLRAQVARLCERLLAFFVRNAALVHPLGARGRAQLAHDAALLEAAVARLQPLEAAASPAVRALHALCALLRRDPDTLDTLDAPDAPECRELPASATLHHLYGRLQDTARGVPAPWQALRLGSLAAYNDWLDRHTDADVWALALRPALEHFAAALNASDAPQYPPLYRRIFAAADALLAPSPSPSPSPADAQPHESHEQQESKEQQEQQ